MGLTSIFHACIPREEILSGELSLDLFAAKLSLVVEGNAPQVYQDPNVFFANTFPTDGLKTLIKEVSSRLVKVNYQTRKILEIKSFYGKTLKACRQDRSLTEPS